MIVLSEPGVDDDLSLFDCREPLRIESSLLRVPLKRSL